MRGRGAFFCERNTDRATAGPRVPHVIVLAVHLGPASLQDEHEQHVGSLGCASYRNLLEGLGGALDDVLPCGGELVVTLPPVIAGASADAGDARGLVTMWVSSSASRNLGAQSFDVCARPAIGR